MKIYRPKETLKGKTVYMAFLLKDQLNATYLNNVVAFLLELGANLKVLSNPYSDVVFPVWFDKYKKDYSQGGLVEKIELQKNDIIFTHNVFFEGNIPEKASLVCTSNIANPRAGEVIKIIQEHFEENHA